MMNVLLEAYRYGYGTDQIDSTMTVGELIRFLEDHYNDDQRIYISNDHGYTYGPINEDVFHEEDEDEDEE